MTPARVSHEWRIAPFDRKAVRPFAQELDIPILLAHVIQSRGITSMEEAKRFLNPSFDQVSRPEQLQGVTEAVARIDKARIAGERILVFGDYDVDGIAGTAIMYGALRRFGIIDCFWDLPHRLTEGFGLQVDRVQAAREEGVSLIITVDNGSAAWEACEAARELDIDLIVTDHHQLGDPPGAPLIMINPVQEDSEHPMARACGALVAFKLAWALTGEPADLDLAALGTVADVMPLVGENRAVVAEGLKQMKAQPRPGIAALARKAGLKTEELTSEQIAFQLAPRINAGGRMGDGKAGVELFLSGTLAVAAPLAKKLDDDNQQRREIESQIIMETEEQLFSEGRPERKTIVLGSRAWHPGVLGIVASRVQARYQLPAVLVGFDENGIGRGSARSVNHVDLAQALAACREHLERFGGHKAAAGMTVDESRFEAFRQQFEDEVTRRWPKEMVHPPLDIDAVVAFSNIDSVLIRRLEALEPCGFGNPPPVFACHSVSVSPDSCRILKEAHLRCNVQDGPTGFPAIGFGMADRVEELTRSRIADIAFRPAFNTWRGETTIQLQLMDLRVGQ